MAFVLAAAACSGGAPTTTRPAEVATTGSPSAATGTSSATTSVPATPATSATIPPSSTTTTEAFTEVLITVAGGSADRVQTYRVSLGDEIRLVVTADVTDEVHLHGYDLKAALAPGTAGVIDFVADIPGIFEIELEDAGSLIGELEVSP